MTTTPAPPAPPAPPTDHPALRPWVESIQDIKDGDEEAEHVLTVFGLAMLEQIERLEAVVCTGTRPMLSVSQERAPFIFHAYEVLAHHGLVSMRMNEAPGWWDVRMTAAGRAALDQATADRDADIANREGRMR